MSQAAGLIAASQPNIAPKQPPTCTNFLIAICGLDELRVTDNCRNPPEIRQKKVAAVQGPEDSFWTYPELLDIACFLHDAHEFKSSVFPMRDYLITNLGWVLVNDPSRKNVVDAMLLLMSSWLGLCENDATCIVPPNLSTLRDPQKQKILTKVEDLKRTLLDRQAELAEAYRLVNAPLSDLDTRLIKFQQATDAARIVA